MPSKVNQICGDKNFVTRENYMAVIEPLMELAISRNEKYGSSIEVMDDSSIVDLIRMKLVRTKNMLRNQEQNGTFDSKVYDEILDSINFLVYICIRMQDQGEEIVPTQGSHN